MALPTAYLTTTKNLEGILNAVVSAQAPSKFTLSFLENLGYKSSSDRLVIGVLKALGFLAPDGTPTDRYFRYLDQTQSKKVLAEGIREAYADLFQLDRRAEKMSKADLKGKMKTLTQGTASDSVINKMVLTFESLVKQADFSSPPPADSAVKKIAPTEETPSDGTGKAPEIPIIPPTGELPWGGLVYTIQIQLPESRDPAVYDALFRSLKTHLL